MQALEGTPLTMFGDGSRTRSFCYVDDLVDGLVRLMATPTEFVGPVNLGNPHEMSILELAEKIVDLTGSRSKVVFKDAAVDDPVRRQPDIQLAGEKLGWKPTTGLEVGLRKTIEYFESLIRGGFKSDNSKEG